jgi:hypothetical protein
LKISKRETPISSGEEFLPLVALQFLVVGLAIAVSLTAVSIVVVAVARAARFAPLSEVLAVLPLEIAFVGAVVALRDHLPVIRLVGALTLTTVIIGADRREHERRSQNGNEPDFHCRCSPRVDAFL